MSKKAKKREFYFKVKGDKTYYCAVDGENYLRAKRNLIFACFSHREDEQDNPFKKRYPKLDDRWTVLNNKYSHRVYDTTKEVYEEMDALQND